MPLRVYKTKRREKPREIRGLCIFGDTSRPSLTLRAGVNGCQSNAPLLIGNIPSAIQELEAAAESRATQTRTVFTDLAASCRVEYGPSHHEICIWHIGLMFVEYVAGLLELKAKDGHCRNHPKPCGLTRELHLRMLGRFKADLLKLVDEMTAIE